MKVLLRRNISKLGQIGEVVEVKDGYARNYLIPQGLAVNPTKANLRVIEAEKAAYFEQLARRRAELEAQAKLLDGKEFTVTALANEEGHLYGSVGPAQVAAAMAEEGFVLDPKNILLDEPIRKLDKYEVSVSFGEDVTAKIGVWVIPPPQADAGESDRLAGEKTSEVFDVGEQADSGAAEEDASQQ